MFKLLIPLVFFIGNYDFVPYSAAYTEAEQTGNVLLVQVSADWCAPCQQQKALLKALDARRVFRSTVITIVDQDREPEIASRINRRGRIPYLVGYIRTKNGWRAYEPLVGLQSERKLTEYIRTLESNIDK
jgi:thioredoxin-like negative regulator of GroEL